MKNRIFQKFIFVLFSCLMISPILTFNSCIESEIKNYPHIANIGTNEYKIFVTEPDTPYFSLEYPSNYHMVNETKGDNNPFLNLGLIMITSEKEYYEIKTRIDVSITNYNPKWLGFPGAKTEMKEYISDTKWALMRNFRLVEKHKAIVGGVEGWETIVTYRERGQFIWPGSLNPAFIVRRSLFFDYQGMTWQISLFSDKGSYEQQTKADFEHILGTFKFHE